MSWRRSYSLVVLTVILQIGQLQSRLHHSYPIRQKPSKYGKLASRNLPRRRQLSTGEVLLEPKIELNDETELSINDYCAQAQTIVPEDLIRGNVNFASVDGNLVNQCVNTEHPGVWYKTAGTGDLLRASLVQENQTAIAVFQGSDCESLSCANIKIPIISATNAKAGSGWTTYWSTEVNTTYFLYVYGVGQFQMILTEQKRPGNDHAIGAITLETGDILEGSTAFASSESNLTLCDSKASSTGVWFSVQGTGSPLQAQLKTSVEGYQTQLSIYTKSMECVDDIERVQFFDPDSSQWYVVSSAAVWETEKNATYYIMVHGAEMEAPGWYESGNFELTLNAHERPTNDKCSSATTIQGGTTVTGTTSFATVDSGVSVCSQISLRDTPTAPGVWYKVVGAGGPLEISVTSLYSSQLTIFTGKNCTSSDFVCVEGTNTPSPDATDPIETFSSSIKWEAEEGEAYYILAHAADRMAGPFELSLTWVESPSTVPAGVTTNMTQGAETEASLAESLHRIDATVKMYFSFFPDVLMHVPTEEEIDGLLDQTKLFYNEVLQSKFDDFVRFGASATTTVYAERELTPVVVFFEFHAFFALPDDDSSTEKELRTPEQLISAIKDVKLGDYIQNYVWESIPFGDNIFYEAMHVVIQAERGDISSPPATVAPSGSLDISQEWLDVVLYFSFHNTSSVPRRKPGSEEVDGLLLQTESFFTQFLQDELPAAVGFSSLKMLATKLDYNETAEFPVALYIAVELDFLEMGDTSPPSAERLVVLMETADMANYVEYYVWFAEPVGSAFFIADQAVLEPYTPETSGNSIHATLNPDADAGIQDLGSSAPAHSNTDSNSSNETVDLLNIETDVVLMFNFFRGDDSHNRAANQEEVDALTTQTHMFFTKVLQNTYDDLVQLDLDLVTAGFAAQANKPSVVSWKVSAVFYVLDGTEATHTPERLHQVLTSSDVEDYLHHYVWSSAPMGTNIFFDTSTVQFEVDDSTNSVNGLNEEETPTPAPTSVPPTNELVLRANILYGFLSGQYINRKPAPEEQEGILYQTSLFFNKLFRRQFSESFKKANTTIRTVTLVEGDSLPIVISYDMIVIFEDVDSVPSSDDLYQVLESANFQSYIEFYVWNAEPKSNGMFFDTQQVVFQTLL